MNSEFLLATLNIQPIKKPLNIEFKGFFRFQWITSERILVGWRQLNLTLKSLFLNYFLKNKKQGIHTGIQNNHY